MAAPISMEPLSCNFLWAWGYNTGLAKSSKKQKTGICVYCGEDGLLTMDHIPPKGLYPQPLWSSLLKIPSCIKCNGGASKDDDYLRTMIGLSAKGKGEELLKPLVDAAMRRLRGRKRQDFGSR
jgi:hypothetical protein